MILSMTGFGRASLRLASLGFDIEVRSVNHRHLDTRVRLPRILSSCEADLRARVQQKISRGKIDLTIATSDDSSVSARVDIDRGVAAEYGRVARELSSLDGVEGSLTIDTLVGLPGVARLVEPEFPADELLDALLGGVDQALAALVAMRASEGKAIEQDLMSRLDRVETLAESINQRSGLVAEAVRERLRKRTEQLRSETGLLDEARLHQEIVIAADRLDVTEEIVRLRSHIEQFREIVQGAGSGVPVGRRLDFLLQEFGREANTIGSKGSDAPIAHDVVELKTELERIREQVQNIE
ncbi:MAG: YicC family protein [Deltaproteobacteria bacterium]|nr:YicC family protein [Deltaproteobacteria bacterium]